MLGALALVAHLRAEEEEVPPPDWAVLAAARLPLLELCGRPNIDEKLLCGSIEVLEDRSRDDGRRIGLSVVVVPAQAEEPPSDPVFVFEGGPGGAATKRAAGSIWAGPVRKRDIVLVDQRGTGQSHSIDCDLGGGPDAEPGKLREMYPPADVRACAARLEETADLSQYTSAQHADDIEEVRRRLGYGPINVRGGSYGTAAMMVFAQRYPDSTRTLFGIGLNSPLRSNLAERGVMTERALGRLTALCDAQATCAALTPGLDERVGKLLTALEGKPLRVRIEDPQTPSEMLEIVLRRDWMAEMLRLNLYFGFTSRALPWAVHRASEGDWQPLAQMAVLVERMFRSTLSYGVALTVQCSEFMDFDVDEALESGSHTLFGNYRLEQQLQGCAEWPHQRQPNLGVEKPSVLSIPTLLLSGYVDPVTPPDYAEEARTIFPNSLHVVLPEGQHGPFDLENSWACVHQMWADLIDHADPGEIDTSCTAAMHRPPFVVDEASFSSHLTEVLVPMVG